jgi:hypothetical protein
MTRHRCAGVIVLFVFVAAIAAPVFAGGIDAPGIPPSAKTMTQIGTFNLDGGNDTPAIPPAGKNHDQNASLRAWTVAQPGWFTKILSVIWGGGSPSPHH